MAGQFEAKRARVVAISVDPPERSRALAEDEHLALPLLSDPELRVVRAWGVADEQNELAWPAVYVIGRDGRVLWRDLSEDFHVRPQAEAVLAAVPAP